MKVTSVMRNRAAMDDLLSALDKCFQPPTIQMVSWERAVRPSVVVLMNAIREGERRATLERIRDRLDDAPDVIVHWMDAILDEEAAR